MLTGSLSSGVIGSRNLVTLKLANNEFRGQFPYHLGSIQTLQIQNNFFSGPLTFAAPNLTVIDITSNKFSGIISSAFFTEFLRIFSASNNCLQPTIPTSVCSSTNLERLLVSGLRLNNCDRNPAELVLTPGEFPDCLWSLPKLETFVGTGNAFDQPLPNDPSKPLGPALEYLDLSSNRMYGTISSVFVNSSLGFVNLSKNRIQGQQICIFSLIIKS